MISTHLTTGWKSNRRNQGSSISFYSELSTRRIRFYERNGYQVLAKNPEVLYEAREMSSILWLMGNQQVEHLGDYLNTIKEKLTHAATGEQACF